jgi:hypothetical protein
MLHNWWAVSFINNQIELKLNITNPLAVSQKKVRDKLIVQFKKPDIFQKPKYKLSDKSTILKAEIRRQLKEETSTKMLASATEALDGTLNLVLGS